METPGRYAFRGVAQQRHNKALCRKLKMLQLFFLDGPFVQSVGMETFFRVCSVENKVILHSPLW